MTSDSIPPTLHTASETEDAARASTSPGNSGGAGNSPGRVIRSARERARLSLEELALQTKLARATLDALERDDFNALNEAVYVRGYYRKCAKVLMLSEAELIAAYEKLVVPKAPQMPTKLLIGGSPSMGRPRSRRRSDGSGVGRVVTIVVVAAVLGAIVWFFFNDPGLINSLRGVPASTTTSSSPTTSVVSGNELAAPPPGSTAREETVPAPASTTETAPSATPEAAAPAPAPIAPPSPSPVAPSVSPSASPAPALAVVPSAAEAAAGPGSLSLSFSSTSWIRVEDVDGKLLLSGVIQAGDRQQVRGRTPYSLFIGNAPGVKVEFDGKVVDTTPFIKSNSTARLTVP